MTEVKCKKYGKELEGLEAPPFPGVVGQEVFENVSAQAWQEWLDLQTKIINEYRIDLSDKGHRKMLQDQMLVFLGLREGDGTQLLDLENVPY